MRRILAVIILTLIIFILMTDDGIFRIVPSTKLKYLGKTKVALKWILVWYVAELSTSLSSYLYAEQNQEVLDSIMARNVSSLTPSELVQFYSIKEAQYTARRARVQAYCRTQQGGNFSRLVYRHLLYDDEAGHVLGTKYIQVLVISICSGPCFCMPNSKGGWNNLAWALCSSR